LGFALAAAFLFLPFNLCALADTATVAASVPLRVEIDHGYRLRAGQQILGHLTEPVYVSRSLVIPAGAQVIGTITATHPVRRGERANALLDGDFTPLKDPVVQFHTLVLPGGARLPIATSVTERTTQMVRFRAGKAHNSLKDQVQAQITQHKDQLTQTVSAPNKMDRLRRFMYGQLPWHPQEIWAGTDFDAELTQPLDVPDAKPPAPAAAGDPKLSGTLEARLITSLDSSTASLGEPVHAVLTQPLDVPDAKPPAPAAAGDPKLSGTLEARLITSLDSSTASLGEPVHAVLTQPLLDTGKHVLLPEGSQLTGVVLQTKPAKSFGRNGALRFTFRDIAAPQQAPQRVEGQVTAAEGGNGQNLSIDDEGGVKAKPDQGRFLAPLVLGLLAAKSLDNDGSSVTQGAVVSNGFGVVARVVGMAASDRSIASGFAYYGLAKSIYRRWIARGHDVTFGRDTRMEIELSER
jgi:hypothetical protein